MKADANKVDDEPRDARAFLPTNPRASLAQYRIAVENCRGCDLYKNATQAVFGEGKARASILMIGEQPGDQEDLQGRPFVGPAGKLLDRALQEIGIERTSVYLTNAVKHFRWTPRGKRRLHAKPSARQVHACLPWLEREIALVKPAVVVCLGATAGQALFGGKFRLGKSRGKVIHDERWESAILATVHPSAILRMPDHDDREREYQAFLADLHLAQSMTISTRPTSV